MSQPAIIQLRVHYQPNYGRWRNARHGIESLSPREMEILKLFASAKTLTEIASLLGVSDSTVQSHRDRAMEKLGLPNNLGVLIHFALNRSLVENLFAQEPNG